MSGYVLVPLFVFVFFIALAFILSGSAMANLEKRKGGR